MQLVDVSRFGDCKDRDFCWQQWAHGILRRYERLRLWGLGIRWIAGVAGPSGLAFSSQDHGIALAVGYDTVCADFIRRGRSGCGPTLSLLYISRESGCPRYGIRQADLEKLCHRRNSEAHASGTA